MRGARGVSTSPLERPDVRPVGNASSSRPILRSQNVRMTRPISLSKARLSPGTLDACASRAHWR